MNETNEPRWREDLDNAQQSLAHSIVETIREPLLIV